jgi:hypothetical protein
MTDATLTVKTVKSCRKNHDCTWCGERVPVGSAAVYRSGKYQGDFYTEYWHIECWAAMVDSDMGYDDEFMPWDQLRGKTFAESHGE